MLRCLLYAVSLGLAVTLSYGCGDDDIPDITLPTPPTVTETFSGTLNRNGAVTHTFATSTAGSVTATLTAVGPDEATVMGVSLGTWNGTACAVVIASDAATKTTVVYGTVSQAGLLCLRVYDVGRFTEDTTYEVTVVHP